MRTDLTLVLAVAASICGTAPLAQEPTGAQDPGQARESVAPDPPGSGSRQAGAVKSGEDPPPDRFVPKETISPDSVVTFPADI